jgi:hypothetical protein
MARKNQALLIAGIAGVGLFMASRARAGVPNGTLSNGNGTTNGTGTGAAPTGTPCVPCGWPTPISFGGSPCEGCFHSPVVPFPFHFGFPWFWEWPVPPPAGSSGWSVPLPGTPLVPPPNFPGA